MPAQRKSSTGTADASPARKSAPKATAKAAPKADPKPDPKALEPEALEPEALEPDASESEAVEPAAAEEEVPMNRAERRARGKGGQQSMPASRGKVAGQHGPAHTHRNWASRRSG